MDSAGRLLFPALDRWAPGQSSLARVVTEATGSLSGQPARADSSPSPSRSGTQHAPLRMAQTNITLGMLTSAAHGIQHQIMTCTKLCCGALSNLYCILQHPVSGISLPSPRRHICLKNPSRFVGAGTLTLLYC